MLSMIDRALALAAMGFRVFPTGRDKVPLFDDWPDLATVDERQLRAWWNRNPEANVGISIDHAFFVLDVDPRNGGDAELARLEERHGALPETLSCLTGGGGAHLFFKRPDGVELRGKVGPGLDVKKQVGYVVGAGSVHASGNAYEWVDASTPIADAPAWLLELAAKQKAEAAPRADLPTVDEETLARARCHAARHLERMPPSVAGKGGDDALWKAAIALVRGYQIPADEALDMLREGFNPRCEPPWDDERLAYKVEQAMDASDKPWGFLYDAGDRAVEEFMEERAAATRPGAYSDEELAALAAAEGFDGDPKDAAAWLRRRWIVQHGHAYYMLDGEAGYSRPLIVQELSLGIDRFLVRAPIERWREGAKGQKIDLKPVEIVKEHGQLAHAVVADLTIARSAFDGTTMHEAVCPMRRLEPAYDADVDEWLRAFGGEATEKLLDWVATVGVVERQTCVPYLEGAKSAGKTLLAHGLARLWTTGGPVELDDTTGAFNDSLTRCPLVFGDEVVSVPNSGTLRAFVGSGARSLKRKYLPTATLKGAPRLILAGNNPDLLSFDRERFSVEDIDAIAERFLHVKIPEQAAVVLARIAKRRDLNDWITNDVIARHALWLAQNRAVQRGKRFLVDGTMSELSERIATTGNVRGLVLEAVVKAVVWRLQPSEAPLGMDWAEKTNGFVVDRGRVLVNASWLHERWPVLVKGHYTASINQIGEVLKGIAVGVARVGPKNGKRTLCHALRVSTIVSQARRLQVGDADMLELELGPATLVSSVKHDGAKIWEYDTKFDTKKTE